MPKVIKHRKICISCGRGFVTGFSLQKRCQPSCKLDKNPPRPNVILPPTVPEAVRLRFENLCIAPQAGEQE